MNYLALIIGLALQQLWGGGNRFQPDDWYRDWWRMVERRRWPPGATLASAIAGPTLLTALLLDLFAGWLFGLVGLGLSVMLLVYGLGRGDFRALLNRLLGNCANGDAEAAWLVASEALPGIVKGESPASTAEALQRVRKALIYDACQRWFAPVFFFVLAGPVAAIAYRLLQLSRDRADDAVLATVLHYADWLPARLLGLSFAITGDFAAFREALTPSGESAASLLAASGRVAVGLSPAADPEISDSQAAEAFAHELGALDGLLTRSSGAWLIALSVGYLFF